MHIEDKSVEVEEDTPVDSDENIFQQMEKFIDWLPAAPFNNDDFTAIGKIFKFLYSLCLQIFFSIFHIIFNGFFQNLFVLLLFLFIILLFFLEKVDFALRILGIFAPNNVKNIDRLIKWLSILGFKFKTLNLKKCREMQYKLF